MNSLEKLEYEKIKNELKSHTVSGLGKKLVDKLKPLKNLEIVRRKINETTEAINILNSHGNIPLQGLHDVEFLLEKVEKGKVLKPSELLKISDFLRGCRNIKIFMKDKDFIAPVLSSYVNSIVEFKDLEEEINASVEGNRISSKMYPSLEKIRKRIKITNDRIEQKLNSILNSDKYRSCIQEFFISNRNGRLTIPFKSIYKNKINGSVIDTSQTGSTVFIEPASINKLSKELEILKMDEEAEEYQVLATITGYIRLYIKELKINIDLMAEYDFVFAKAKYSFSIKGVEAIVNNKGKVNIIEGKHPLLENDCVPLNFTIGDDYRTLVITGPNTGGKTVALKTIGILTLMTQSGLHIPAKKGTEISIFDNILVDIGDNQSIEQSLSTFSGHIKNIIKIISNTNFATLVLLDEIGTGTDPSEGAGLAASILHELYSLGAITVATTHYGEIKEYASQHKGFENGCMEFDPNTLKPLYKLNIGKAGTSNALWIANKLGLRKRVLNNAKKYINKRKSDERIEFDIDDCKLEIPKDKTKKEDNGFNKGDCVIIKKTNEKAIIYEVEDEYGDLTVLLKDEFIKINKKRVKLFIKKEQLYPEGYDLDNVFVSWDKRKIKKEIEKGTMDLQKAKEIFNKS
ncbi:MAG: endonuclease MutS2 [Firmicutes bacterium]|nr:endonuclease MutS2 [Bacillota bacterium]